MLDYAGLRTLVSHRVRFDYDSGARIVGTLVRCNPASGPVQLVVLGKAAIYDAAGRILEHHDELTLVPNVLVGVRLAEGPRERDG